LRRRRSNKEDRLSSRSSKLRRLCRKLRLRSRNKSSWLLRLFKRPSKLLLEELLPRQTSLD